MSTDPTFSRPGPRPRYTREQVLDAALTLLDRDGPDAFSMRRLADELGLGVMTLYGYVRNRDEVIVGVTAVAFAAIQRPAAGSGDWVERLRADAEDLYRFCTSHPHVVSLILQQTSSAPGFFQVRERMLGTLTEAGFDQVSALHALGVLSSYALGFGRTSGGAVPIELPERIRELPADAFPHLAAAADCYALHVSDAAFAYGLGLILRGLAADLQAAGRSSEPIRAPTDAASVRSTPPASSS